MTRKTSKPTVFRPSVPLGLHLFEQPLLLNLDGLTTDNVLPSEVARGFHQAVYRETVKEALQRGANDEDLRRLVFELVAHHATRIDEDNRVVYEGMQARPPYGLGFAFLDPELSRLILEETLSYRLAIRKEFDDLPGEVRKGFGSDFERYLAKRPDYYNAGYNQPAETIFQKIKTASFLGHRIGEGIHDVFVDRLKDLEATLNSLNNRVPDAAKRTASEIHGVIGFSPRDIQPGKLSNHAYGLAIDIDATVNPQIHPGKGGHSESSNVRITQPEVIEQFHWVLRKKGLRFDFGKPYVEPDQGVGDLDRIMEIHNRAQRASDVIREWLTEYLPQYKEELRAADAKKTKSRKPEGHQLGASLADENLGRLQIINEYHDLKTIERWAERGIQTIPLYLALAMAKLGFRWGQEYEGSKDAMHFELLYNKAIPPDVPEPRSLAELFPSHVPASTASRRAKRSNS